MATNYDKAQNLAARIRGEDWERVTAQVAATLAVADELRALTEVLGSVVGFTGSKQSRAFIRVFDEANDDE